MRSPQTGQSVHASRHLDVRQDNADPVLRELPHGLIGVVRFPCLIARLFNQSARIKTDKWFVIHDEDRWHFFLYFHAVEARDKTCQFQLPQKKYWPPRQLEPGGGGHSGRGHLRAVMTIAEVGGFS